MKTPGHDRVISGFSVAPVCSSPCTACAVCTTQRPSTRGGPTQAAPGGVAVWRRRWQDEHGTHTVRQRKDDALLCQSSTWVKHVSGGRTNTQLNMMCPHFISGGHTNTYSMCPHASFGVCHVWNVYRTGAKPARSSPRDVAPTTPGGSNTMDLLLDLDMGTGPSSAPSSATAAAVASGACRIQCA